jgi:helix-turn-helix protein
MIAYPICLAGEICAVLVVVRKECDDSDLQNFLGEDLVKIKSVVDRMIFVQLAKTA